jgi:aldose 1-epimerase
MIKQTDWQGVPVQVMENESLEVYLCPSIGNNVYRVWDKIRGRELLRTPASPEDLKAAPVQYGTPVLMPPNRIRRGTFQYEGRKYQFDINHPTGNHIHGLITRTPWKVAETAEGVRDLAVTCRLQTGDHPEILRQYPHDLALEMTYSLTGASLTQRLTVANRGEASAPFGYGLHTWFRIDGKPEEWTLTLPCEGIWELDKENLPTGKLLPLEKEADPNGGIYLKGQNLDTVFQIGKKARTAVLSGAEDEIRYSLSSEFRQWVVYTKGEADEFVCLEPYTWVTDAPNLGLDPELTGLKGIRPGESLTLEVALEVVRLA